MPQLTPTDPLFPTQWGLQNRGQQGGHIGTDINVLPVLGTGFGQVDGTGVRVAVIDDGMELAHPDLAANVDVAASYDATTNRVGGGAGGVVNRTEDTHGTAVAGIIGAALNGVGSVGVAPAATLVSERLPFSDPPPPANGDPQDPVPTQDTAIIRAFRYAVSARIDVANNSWGSGVPFSRDFVNAPQSSFGPALEALARDGRDGKGTAVVVANGNDRSKSANGALNGFKSSRFVIAVGAMDNNGVTSDYSTPGANLLVTAPAGGTTGQRPSVPGNAITTTDLLATDGYNKQSGTSGDYTFDFNGTSAAAPFVSGVVALMLQANPGLGYRDVKQILAQSARLTDASSALWHSDGLSPVNGGGMHFNTDYGFGLVDAHAAVRLAQSARLLGAAAQDEANVRTVVGTYGGAVSDLGNGIEVGDSWTGEDGTTVAGTGNIVLGRLTLGAGTVEHLDLNLTLSVPDASRIKVTLVSPSGREIVLLPEKTNAGPWPVTFPLGTDAFWGEQAEGTWGFAIQSIPKLDSNGAVLGNAGRLNAATLTVYTPAAALTVNNLVYTDDFAAMAADQPDRSVITGQAGVANVLNLSATSGTNVLDLTGRVGSIGGQAVSIGTGTRFDTVFGGDGANTIFAGASNQTIHTGYGQTTLNLMAGSHTVFSKGQDTIFAGSGNSVVFGQGPTMFAVGGTGAVTVSGASGSDTLFGGTGGGVFFGGGAGNNVLVGGSGSSTIVGGGGGDVLFATGAKETILIAGSGNQTLFGGASTAGNVYFAGSGTALIGGGTGADRFFLGSGAATLDGGGGGDLLVFRAGLGGGTVRVNNFSSAGGDRLTLQGYAAGEATRSLAGATVNAAGDTVLSLSDNTRITFAGVTSLNPVSFV